MQSRVQASTANVISDEKLLVLCIVISSQPYDVRVADPTDVLHFVLELLKPPRGVTVAESSNRDNGGGGGGWFRRHDSVYNPAPALAYHVSRSSQQILKV